MSLSDLVTERASSALSMVFRGQALSQGEKNLTRSFPSSDLTKCFHKFKQNFQAADAIGDSAGLDCLSRGGRILSNPILLEYAEPKWHQSGIFIKEVEAHGVSPCRGALRAVP